MPDPKQPADDRNDPSVRDSDAGRRQPRPLADGKVPEDGRRPSTRDGYASEREPERRWGRDPEPTD